MEGKTLFLPSKEITLTQRRTTGAVSWDWRNSTPSGQRFRNTR